MNLTQDRINEIITSISNNPVLSHEQRLAEAGRSVYLEKDYSPIGSFLRGKTTSPKRQSADQRYNCCVDAIVNSSNNVLFHNSQMLIDRIDQTTSRSHIAMNEYLHTGFVRLSSLRPLVVIYHEFMFKWLTT